MPKKYHPAHTLIDLTSQELADLERAGEITAGDSMAAKWRKERLWANTGDPVIQRYQQMKAAEEIQTK